MSADPKWLDVLRAKGMVASEAGVSLAALHRANNFRRVTKVVESEKPKSKYRNVRTNGFASKRESDRYDALALLEMAGRITDLETQVRFPLVVNDVKIADYVSDFVYFENGEKIVEDAKGMRTPAYRLKAKLMKAIHGITIRET